MLRNPVKLIDPDGKQVDATYTRTGATVDPMRANAQMSTQEKLYNSLHNQSINREEPLLDIALAISSFYEAKLLFSSALELNTGTTLFRAVTKDELSSIKMTGTYSLPEGIESKYFWTNEEDSKWFINGMNSIPGLEKESYTITKINIESKLLQAEDVSLGSDVNHVFYNIGKNTLSKFSKAPSLLEKSPHLAF